MPTRCCVANCGSRSGRDVVQFFKIPSELHFLHRVDLNELSRKRRQKWIQAIKREELTEKKLSYGRVCSKHFLSGKPSDLTDHTSPDWVPSLVMGYDGDEVVLKRSQTAVAKTEEIVKRRKLLSISEVNTTSDNEVIVISDTESN